MCNLYSITTNQQAIREFTRAMVDRVGNLPVLPGVFPDYAAPIVRHGPDGRELVMARWGMPSSQRALFEAASTRADKLRSKGKEVDSTTLLRMEPDPGTTNIRNTASSHWRRWLGPESRCGRGAPGSAAIAGRIAADRRSGRQERRGSARLTAMRAS